MRRVYAAVVIILIGLSNVGADFVPALPQNQELLKIEDSNVLPVEKGMYDRIVFWVKIYAFYSQWQTVLHDKEYPHIIYGVVESNDSEKRPKPGQVAKARAAIISTLQSLDHKRGKNLTPHEQHLSDLFAGIKGDRKYLDAIKRIRPQGGLRDSLSRALHLSGRYLPRMERVFRDAGLPPEIAYLPFVESSFNKDAISKVGASGIWQIMPATGREFVRVDDVVDERNDPMRSAEAAARLMAQNFKFLETWPLAITAYNHGRVGVGNAVKATGSKSLVEIIRRYEGPNFGFASSNFYASFIAARHVARNHDYYLGFVEKARVLEFDEFFIPDYVDASVLAPAIGVSKEILRDLNPALTEKVWTGEYRIPVGYSLRIPMSAREGFLRKYEAIAPELKYDKQKAPDAIMIGGNTQK